MKDLSMDLKSRAVVLLEQDMSTARVAERLLVSKRRVERIRNYWTEHGELPVSRRKGKTEKLLEAISYNFELTGDVMCIYTMNAKETEFL